jgi:Arc/MetJ-type ribon-helix-helix transcriptional regulator
MTIEISAEDAQMLESLVASGRYESIASCVHAALSGLAGRYDEAAAAHIDEGLGQLDRAEGRLLDEVLLALDRRKAAWRQNNAAS